MKDLKIPDIRSAGGLIPCVSEWKWFKMVNKKKEATSVSRELKN